jgi:LysM repeat protein
MDLQLVKESMTPRFVAVLVIVGVAHLLVLGTGFAMLRDNAAAPIEAIDEPEPGPSTAKTGGSPSSTQGFQTVPADRSSTNAAAATGRTHTVQAGESYWAIAQKYGVSESAIRAANNQSRSHVIHPGNVLKIPN